MANKRKPIAIAVYLDDGGDISEQELYTEKDVEKAKTNEHKKIGYFKTIIVFPDMTTYFAT